MFENAAHSGIISHMHCNRVESMERLLTLIKYKEHQWNVCGDLKVVNLAA